MRLAVGDKDAMKYEAYINGIKEKYCIMADEEEGVAKVYVHPDFQTFMEKYPAAEISLRDLLDYTKDVCATVRGKVELRRMEC